MAISSAGLEMIPAAYLLTGAPQFASYRFGLGKAGSEPRCSGCR